MLTITNSGAGAGGTLYGLSIENSAATVVGSYNPVTAASIIKFTSGTDIDVEPTYSSGTFTITPSLTHRLRALSYAPTYGGTVASIYDTSYTTTPLVVQPGNSNIQIAYSSNVMSISGTDTWRPISMYAISSGALSAEALQLTDSSTLAFTNDFATSGTGLQIVWAEIS